MLTVEKVLQALDDVCLREAPGQLEITNQWDRRFISDVAGHVGSGSPISTAQGEIVLKLISRYQPHLVQFGFNATSLEDLLRTPQYATPPYQSTALPREVRWMGDNKLVFRFKFNAVIMEEIKRLKGANHFLAAQYPAFSREEKLWIVDVNSENLDRVMDFIKRHRFAPDDKTIEYFLAAANAQGSKPVIEVEQDVIRLTVTDDDLVNSWANLINKLEP